MFSPLTKRCHTFRHHLFDGRLARLGVLLVVAAASCGEQTSIEKADPTSESAIQSPSASDSTSTPQPPPTRVDIPVIGEDAQGWLTVEQVRPDAAGAWATGSFDPANNRLTIKTKDVQRFAIDTSLVSINWQKPVVFTLDGITSELRRRERPVIHLVRSERAEWTILEP